MPILNWIGKDKIINYHKEVPFRLLNEKKKFSVNGNSTENLLIKGDNLEALKALLPYYCNKVKAIYIDPPYNTGNENWIYNDNVNSPEMRKWLGKVVGPEGEDLNRHDKWLCMMMPRLKLLWELLRYDGVIFVSIDDNEVHNLRMLLDEVFRPRNWIAQLIWRKKYGGGKGTKYFVDLHEYIYVYSKDKALLNTLGTERTDQQREIFEYEDEFIESRGKYYIRPLKSGLAERKTLVYPITCPDGSTITTQWICSRKTFDRLLNEGRIVFKKLKDGKYNVYKKFYGKDKGGLAKPESIIYNLAYNQNAKEEIKHIFNIQEGREIPFENAKPSLLIKYLLSLTTDDSDIILDSFAGSGTTGHAVLELNKEDGGNRKFILVELEDNIAENITTERLKRVIQGYSYKKGNNEQVKVEGLSGGFKFLELAKPLFDRHKQIIGQPSYEDLAGYVYFVETHKAVNWEKANRNDWYIGEDGGVHYFIIYKSKGENELGEKFLEIARRYKGRKIVYAEALMLDDNELEKYDIVFKQIPYDIKIF